MMFFDKIAYHQARELMYHQRTHRQLYSCNVCEKQFPSKLVMKKHKLMHSTYKPFWCPNCYQRFNDFGDFVKHRKQHYDENKYKCIECEAAFESKASLVRHEEFHFRLPSDEDKVFKCELCQKNFSYVQFESHIDKKHGDLKASILCPHCGVCLKSPNNLRAHLETYHLFPNIYSCDICSKLQPSISKLEYHLKNHYAIPVRCPKCPRKVFAWNLENHLNKHKSGPTCPICKKIFSTKHGMSQHLSSHHGKNEYHCYLCRVAFMTTCGVFLHMQVMHPLEATDEGCINLIRSTRSENAVSGEDSVKEEVIDEDFFYIHDVKEEIKVENNKY